MPILTPRCFQRSKILCSIILRPHVPLRHSVMALRPSLSQNFLTLLCVFLGGKTRPLSRDSKWVQDKLDKQLQLQKSLWSWPIYKISLTFSGLVLKLGYRTQSFTFYALRLQAHGSFIHIKPDNKSPQLTCSKYK